MERRALAIFMEAYQMPEQKVEQCAHPSCVCNAAEDSKFCSAYCEGASDKPDITCGCGHAACVAKETVTTAGGAGVRYTY